MIKNIFFDLDECLIHTQVNQDPEQDCLKFIIGEDNNTYYTIIHPRALFLIDYARKMTSLNNVFILTTSTKDYASEINELAGFGFEEQNILSRETLDNYSYPAAYGGRSSIFPIEAIANKNNILIDNLPWKSNFNKMDLIGITKDRYLHVGDYYGVNYPDDIFEVRVTQFIDEKYYENE